MKKLLITIGLITGAGSLFAGPIHDAARAGDLEKIKSLVNSGVDIDSMTKNTPYTPLHIATSRGKIEVVDLLISLGANLDTVSYDGSTALLNTIRTEGNEIAMKLILGGASLDQVKGARTTPLIAACNIGNETVIDLLLLKGADINQKDKGGATAIHALADGDWRGNEKLSILKQFISKGANINAIASFYSSGGAGSDNFVTPLDLISDNPAGDNDRLDLLLENGAKTATQVLEDRFSSLEQNVEQGSTGNTNPTDEWPRKMWEIDLGQKIDSIDQWFENGGDNSILLKIYSNNKTLLYWISNTGSIYLLPKENDINLMFLSNDALIYESQDLVTGLFRNKGTIIKKTFQHSNLTEPDWNSPAVPVQVSYEGSVITGWDFTPPTLASTDQEDGNNGGNIAMSRLSIGTSGPDISIATDGKLGGPAVLQKSNDLKNWRKLGDVPADGGELLITPRDNGNEFFRLRKKE